MAWENLKNSVAEVIKTNGNQKITGQLLQNTLINLVSSVGENATCAGFAEPTTNPGAPDGNVFYFSDTPGTYINFGEIAVEENEFAVLLWSADTKVWIKRAVMIQGGGSGGGGGVVINGDVINNPDNEDIESVPGNAEVNVLRFKNRDTSHGMGYVILRNNKTFAEQVTQANTIYEIRYNFNLNSNIVSIPENCILKFNGGSLSNGTIRFNKTKLENEQFNKIEFEGTVTNVDIDVKKLGADNTGVVDVRSIINWAVNSHKGKDLVRVFFPAGEYHVSKSIDVPNNVEIYGEGEISKIICTNATSFVERSVFITSWIGDWTAGTSPMNPVNSQGMTLTPITAYGNTQAEIVTQLQAEIGDFVCVLQDERAELRCYFYECVEKVVKVESGKVYLEHSLPIPSEFISLAKIVKIGGMAYNKAQFVSENIYIHDLFLGQTWNNKTGGYAIFGGGYNNRYENLFINAATTFGSNLNAYCCYLNITATVYDGYIDLADLNYMSIIDGFYVKRSDKEVVGNKIWFNFSNGYGNKLRNLHVNGETSPVGILISMACQNKAEVSDIYVTNITFTGANYTSKLVDSSIISPTFIKNLYLENCIIQDGAYGFYFTIPLPNSIISGIYARNNSGFTKNKSYIPANGIILSDISSDIPIINGEDARKIQSFRYNVYKSSGEEEVELWNNDFSLQANNYNDFRKSEMTIFGMTNRLTSQVTLKLLFISGVKSDTVDIVFPTGSYLFCLKLFAIYNTASLRIRSMLITPDSTFFNSLQITENIQRTIKIMFPAIASGNGTLAVDTIEELID